MSNIDQSIAHMMEVLNPRRQRRRTELRTVLDIESSVKRRLSSDSSDTPEKKAKTEGSLDVSWLASPRETRRIRTDLMEARNHISNLEHRIQHMHGVRKELQTMFDNEIKSRQLQHDIDKKKIDELELQMQAIRKREKDAQQRLDIVEEDHRSSKIEYEARIEDMDCTINELQSQIQEYEREEREHLAHVDADNTELTQALENAQKETQFHKELVADLKLRLSKTTSLTNEMEIKDQMLQNAQLKIKEMEYTLDGYGEWQLQSKMQQQKLSTFPDLEREVHRLRDESKNLRDEIQNKLILEEQVHDLNTRLEYFRNNEKKMSTLQVANAQLEQIVNEWYTMAREIVETPCADIALVRHMKQSVEHLQQQEIALTTEKIQLDSLLKSCQHELKSLKSEHEKSLKLTTDLKTIQQQHQALVHRLQKKLTLVSRERDSYRLQLDSYEKDLTINIVPGQGPAQMQMVAQRERIETLERITEEYREMLSTLENELRTVQPQLNTDNLVPIRSEQLARLQEETEKLRNENLRLIERCDELEIRLEEEMVGKDTVKGKVVHLKMNPLSECLAENETSIQKLQEEVDRLKHKLRKTEEGLESSKLSESICSSREVQIIKEKVKSSEIKMQRMKEYFKSLSHEFREVCYMLFGYKIDRVNSQMYKLSSMYAESPNDYLEFQLNNDGNLNMIETQFSSTLDDLIDLHLTHQGSIPAFLCAVTMDLFNRTTMAATNTFVS